MGSYPPTFKGRSNLDKIRFRGKYICNISPRIGGDCYLQYNHKLDGRDNECFKHETIQYCRWIMTPKNDPSELMFFVSFLSCLTVGLLPSFWIFPKKSEWPIPDHDYPTISINETFYHAKIKPRYSILVAIMAFTFTCLIKFVYHNDLLALITLAICGFSAVIPLLDMKIKRVSVSDVGLVISDFSQTIVVPFHEIKRFKAGNTKATGGYTIVTFNARTQFGRSIYFRSINLGKIKNLLEPAGIKLDGVFNDY